MSAPIENTTGGAMDGRFGLYLEVERCVGCEACVVACMDQNDLQPDRKEHAWRRVFALPVQGDDGVRLPGMHALRRRSMHPRLPHRGPRA